MPMRRRPPPRAGLLVGLALLVLLAPSAAAGALRILVTNDDGVGSPGIRALRTALADAGHHVVVVAPRTNQSGKGASLRTDVGGAAALQQPEPGVWSVDGTPADAVRAALDAVLADAAPDLVVSGLNFGPNLGRPGAVGSGTVGAALTAVHRGVPALATSVG
ncbi:MAG: 5'/3'-nucleotidase SurE, partial [Myxococcota bacterium]|nr:5'/3'-nucleotidase SurE [Myxococcota bacterium]